jgi:hypothetical protein
MKLASEKIFNRGVCPVMNIKGKTVDYPFIVQHKTFKFCSNGGILGPKQMMIMDIIGTTLIHEKYGNQAYSDRIPTPKDRRVQKFSGLYMSQKLLKYVDEHLSPSHQGIIPEAWYGKEGRLHGIDKEHSRIKNALYVTLNDGIMRKELPFMRKYSSVQIRDLIVKTSECVLHMNYPIRFFNGNAYQTFLFDNYNRESKLFTLNSEKISKKSKDNHILEREYIIQLNTTLGYMFMQNMISCYMDLLPGKFYEMSDYAQLFYRLFILSYFPNTKSGKTPKNPVSLSEIRKRLVLKTRDTYMVRKTVKRILTELKDYKFISESNEEKAFGGDYLYSYKKNTWKDITGEEEPSETEMDFIGN